MDPTLIRGIVRANAWFNGLITGKFKTLRDIANREKLPERYVRRVLEIAFLSPDITEAVAREVALADVNVQRFTEGKEIVKIIAKLPKMISIVAK